MITRELPETNTVVTIGETPITGASLWSYSPATGHFHCDWSGELHTWQGLKDLAGSWKGIEGRVPALVYVDNHRNGMVGEVRLASLIG